MSFNNIDPKKKKLIGFGLVGFILIVVIVSLIVIMTGNNGELGGGANYADDQEFDQDAGEYWEKYPIISYLPIVEDDYRVDYGACETSDGEFCLLVSANTQENRDKALKELEDAYGGRVPAIYKVEYFALEQ